MFCGIGRVLTDFWRLFFRFDDFRNADSLKRNRRDKILSEEIEETKIQIQSVEMFSESFENGCRNDETGTFDLESATLPQFEHKKSIIM